MKQIKIFLNYVLLILWACFFVSAHAMSADDLQTQRIQVLKRYVVLLGKGDYQTLPTLFTQDAQAVSSSGLPDKIIPFYKTLFTKTISAPKSNLINIFSGKIDPDMMAAYFNFQWKNEKKKVVSAKFLDLFIFEPKTRKIKNIFIFSNTFKDDIMKQLSSL